MCVCAPCACVCVCVYARENDSCLVTQQLHFPRLCTWSGNEAQDCVHTTDLWREFIAENIHKFIITIVPGGDEQDSKVKTIFS